MITLAIADDEALFRRGLQLLIEDLGGMAVIMEATDGQDLLDQLASSDNLPQIVLLDLNMPRLNGMDTAKVLRVRHPELSIIVLSTYFEKAIIVNMIEMGAASYLPKNTPPEEMQQTIRAVAEQGFFYTREIQKVIHQNIQHKPHRSAVTPFHTHITEREQEVLQLICQQYTAAEIAAQLHISPRTVDGHRNNLLQKLNCRNTAGLVVFAVQHQLVDLSKDPFWS